MSMFWLAWAFSDNGRKAEALTLAEETFNRRNVVLGPGIPTR